MDARLTDLTNILTISGVNCKQAFLHWNFQVGYFVMIDG